MPKYLKNHQIDRGKWDMCLNDSSTNLLYAKSWFLDIVAPGWEALVLDDYKYVMPIPVKSKYGFRYVVQPNISKQLGVFSKYETNGEIVQGFLDELVKHYGYVRMSLNRNNCLDSYINAKLIEYNNHELDLNREYGLIQKKYKRRAWQNINRAASAGVTCELEDLSDGFFSFAAENMMYVHEGTRKKYLFDLQNIIKHSCSGVSFHVFTARNKKGMPVAMGLFVKEGGRIYYLHNCGNMEGKESQASYILTDTAIKTFAKENAILDFTGSSIKGVRYYIESYGAEPFKYKYIEYCKPKSVIGFLRRYF